MKTLSERSVFADYLIKNSIDFIGAADENGDIIEYNPAALRAFGYTLDEIKRVPVRELYANEEDYIRVTTALDKYGKFVGEVRNKRKNGEEFICFLSANVLCDDDGNTLGVMGVSHDISLEKELARKLEIQNEKNVQLLEEFSALSRIATNVTNGVVLTDPEGRIKWCNESFQRISGFSTEELIGYRPSEIFPVPHFFRDEFDELIENAPLLEDAVQIPHYRKNGELYWLLVESTPVYNDEGKMVEIIEVCTEITAQKNAEIALAESEANFRQMSETIEDVFFLYGVQDEEYEYISPNSTQLMGASPDFFYEGNNYSQQYIHEEDRHLVRKGRMEIANGHPYDAEFRILINDEVRWLKERVFPIRNEFGEVIKGSGVVSDITRLKRDRELIDAQNKNIAESITYAHHIQRSTLQDEQDVYNIFPESFLFFKPKGELSGDFYLMEHVVTDKKERLPVFVVADCTGHGVPGAILSILCISLIRQTLTHKRINSPAEALDAVRNNLGKLFQPGETKRVKDGMDVGFCVVHEDLGQVRFSGAKMNAHLLRDGRWIELKGSKQHVGYSETPEPFNNVIFNYEKGDYLYLFTDGYVDQFGGGKNKKYLKKRLLRFLASIVSEPIQVQRELVDLEFHSWKGDEEQTDDICLFGVKLP
ncbi:MAG: PAS domain S-box protein [Flavobacteriales bacterium]|nr:PAS domain S-box protein [Flavobacteriales bacterium]